MQDIRKLFGEQLIAARVEVAGTKKLKGKRRLDANRIQKLIRAKRWGIDIVQGQGVMDVFDHGPFKVGVSHCTLKHKKTEFNFFRGESFLEFGRQLTQRHFERAVKQMLIPGMNGLTVVYDEHRGLGIAQRELPYPQNLRVCTAGKGLGADFEKYGKVRLVPRFEGGVQRDWRLLMELYRGSVLWMDKRLSLM